MKVLFQSRSTLFSVPGGDTVQLLKTAEFLRGLGIAVEISTELEPALEGYDLVHLFNLMRPQEVYLQAANAKRQGRPVVLSTIYGLYTEYERKARTGMAGFVARHASPWEVERLKVVARAFTNREVNRGTLLVAGVGYEQLCRKVTELCDVFLPNSPDEMRRVNADFPETIGKPFVVVPNAVDVAVFDPMRVRIGDSAKRFAGCVLSVARIEGRKCQLELVRAVNGLPVKLVLIGSPAPNHTAYFEAVRAVAGNNVHILGQVPHAELAQYYAMARVHALVSWMETPGLSSLEAGAMGCNLVVTEKGDTRAYFGDQAFYCDPESVDSIRCALQAALAAPPSRELQDRIRSDFTWAKAAEMTFLGYEKALARQ